MMTYEQFYDKLAALTIYAPEDVAMLALDLQVALDELTIPEHMELLEEFEKEDA